MPKSTSREPGRAQEFPPMQLSTQRAQILHFATTKLDVNSLIIQYLNSSDRQRKIPTLLRRSKLPPFILLCAQAAISLFSTGDHAEIPPRLLSIPRVQIPYFAGCADSILQCSPNRTKADT